VYEGGDQACLYAHLINKQNPSVTTRSMHILCIEHSHFSVQQIIARKQYSWTRKMWGTSDWIRNRIRVFRFSGNCSKPSYPDLTPLFNTMICDVGISLDGCNVNCHGGPLKGRSLIKWDIRVLASIRNGTDKHNARSHLSKSLY